MVKAEIVKYSLSDCTQRDTTVFWGYLAFLTYLVSVLSCPVFFRVLYLLCCIPCCVQVLCFLIPRKRKSACVEERESLRLRCPNFSHKIRRQSAGISTGDDSADTQKCRFSFCQLVNIQSFQTCHGHFKNYIFD